MSSAPQIVNVTILDEDETAIAAVAVRMYLADLRATWRRHVRRGENHYAARDVEKFDAALDLYERLGGDIDRVIDIDEKVPDAR